MQNVAELFSLWPSDADLVRDLGLPYQTVVAWKQRGSIPVAYWYNLIRAAHRRGLSQVTSECLVELHGRDGRKGKPPSKPKSSEAKPATQEGHFSRFKQLRRPHFASGEEIVAHIRALREEWDRR
jgi:hypothetical protein